MNKKIIKKLLITLTLIMILFLGYKIIKTYGVFYSEAVGEFEQAQAVWKVSVNKTNISSGIEQEFIIDKIDYEGRY